MTDGYSVDARNAEGVQVGDGSTQINYFYNGTWMGGPTPPPLVGVSGRIESPYRGLSAFGERDAAFFFGRETAATDVLNRMDERLRYPGLMMVSGVSGAGKSSLLCAGVLPRLRGTGLGSAPEAASWPCSVFTPTRSPLEELAVQIAPVAGADAAAIRRSLATDPADFALTARQAATGPGRVVLVVDQFEQIFTQCEDKEERRAFLTALHAAASGEEPAALVVLVVRADFEAHCADYADLMMAVQHRYLVTAMTERQMRMAITEPAVRAGSRVDGDLVEVLLREARAGGEGTGVLPLLSHALDQAWRGREGTDLRLADYERTGGVEGAVAGSAQRAYDRLSPSQQAIARRIFVRLTTTTAGGVDTADRVERADLIHGRNQDEARDAAAVLESFVAERLITLAADTVQISHEVLLKAWPLLRDEWLAETHADRIIRIRLRTAAAEWVRNSRDPSYLYGGSLLRDVSAAADHIAANPLRHPPLDAAERAFIQASGRVHRRNRRLRQGLLAALGVLVLGLATVAAVAVRTGREAIDQRDTSVADQLAVKSETLGDDDPTVSALESVAAWRIKHTAEARYSMLAAAARPGIAALPDSLGLDGYAFSAAFSPDGRTLAVVSGSTVEKGALRFWDVATHRPIGAPIVDRTAQVLSVAFSPDGKTVAARIENSGLVRFWDAATHQAKGELNTDLKPLPPGGGNPSRLHDNQDSLSYSPDGRFLVTGSNFGTVRLWDAVTRRPIGAPFGTLANPAGSVAFSPDSKTLAIGDSSGRVRLWELATRRPLAGFRTDGPVKSMAFDRDGRLATAGGKTVRLWNTARTHTIATFPTKVTSSSESMAFSPDGRVLATAGNDSTVRLWDTAMHQQLGPPLTGAAGLVAFSPDGTLASRSDDGSMRLWNIATRPIGDPLAIHNPDTMEFTPDGATLAIANFTDRVHLWSTTSHREVAALPSGHRDDPIRSVAFTADGKTAAIGGASGTLQLWDMTRRRRIADLNNRASQAFSMTFSHDGRTLAVGSDNGRVSLWNVPGHRHITDLAAGTGNDTDIETKSNDVIGSMAFTADGKILATATEEGGTVRLWNTSTYQQSGSKLDSAGPYVAFLPGGRTLITKGSDGTVQTWDTATNRPISRFSAVPGVTTALNPDGRTLATADNQGDIHLWDIATGHEIGSPLTGPTVKGRPTLAFSKDGNTLAGGVDEDPYVWVWHIDYLRDPLPRLCKQAGRSLTRPEWRRDVPPGPAYRPICAKRR